jgi:hypothetical protein
MLINQVQRISSNEPLTGTIGQQVSFDLNLLNHPVKCLMWGSPLLNNANAFSTGNVQMHINGTELFGSKMPDKMFTQVQAYHHTEFASSLMEGDGAIGTGGGKLKMYSFAVKANKHYPTGSCNFSRLDNGKLTMTCDSLSVFEPFYLHAVNFNILRIKKGLCGLAFAN